MSTRLYKFMDYKAYLAVFIADCGIRGIQSKLAEAAGCQRAYLSRVLNSDADLTAEQACGIAEYLCFNEAEMDYFLDLVAFARAGTPALRRKLKARLDRLRATSEELAQRYATQSLQDPFAQGVYYSSWHWAAIHIATGIEELQTAGAIAERLRLPEANVLDALQTLERFGLIRRLKDRWRYNSASQIHLPKESMMTSMNHANWRQRAQQSYQDRRTDGLHYSVVHSHGREDFERLKETLLDSIDQTRRIVDPAENEDLSCICIDCFRL